MMRTIDLNISPVLRTIAAVAGALGLAATSASAQSNVSLIAAPLTKSVTLPNGSALAVPMWGFALDIDGDGVLDPAEDRNGNGILDPAEDRNGNGVLDPSEDLNGNGVLDAAEDLNGNGILDPGEDLNGNGTLDPTEDANGNGVLDPAEDANGNGVLDPAEDANGNGALDPAETATVPGPRITVPAGASSLTIQLTNRLPSAVSLVIPGQPYSATPVRAADGRITSMTAEAAPGGTQTYVFNNLKPGTFLYQSGSHPAVQVQMGLYGAMTLDAAAGEAYAGVAYANDVLLLYSEIDIALHDAVASGTYGNAAARGPTSTIDYKPTLFLINGDSYANDATPSINAGGVGQRILIRLLNAGLRSHAPLLENGLLQIVAEDGNKFPYDRTQAALLLAAGKTHDAIWTPASGGVFPIYDRMLSLSAEGAGEAGMLAKLRVAAPGSGGTVTPADDAYTVTEDQLFNIEVGNPGEGVLANDTAANRAELVTRPRSAAAFTLRTNGTFQYRGSANFFGVDSFTYRALRVAGGVVTERSAPVTVTITVRAVADPPRGLAKTIGIDFRSSQPVTLDASDPDGEAITFYLTQLPPARRGYVSIIDPQSKVERILTDANLRGGASPVAIAGGHLIFTAAPVPGQLPIAAPYNTGFNFLVVDAGGSADIAERRIAVTVRALELTAAPTGSPLNLAVVGSDGAAIASYKWTLEEDHTYDVVPGVSDPNTLAVSFHRSYMPVTQSGDQTKQPIVDAAKQYFVSVLPTGGGYSNGGTRIARNQTSATVVVNHGPQPTAQIRVRVFHDNAPLNGVWDPSELGLQGFQVSIDDAGGRYGMSGGQQMFDAYGNQIGTVYAPCGQAPCDGLQVANFGQGFVLTDADGWALIQNLPPGKYAVKVRTPGGDWQQTSTIEGTRAIDAWVKANEPQYFMEFGPPGPHADVGFVRKTSDPAVIGTGNGTISGQITNMHMSRPPDAAMFSGAPYDFTRPWVALNTGAIGGTLIYAGPTTEDGSFSIAGVPDGTYQLWVFDSALDIIIGSKVVNVPMQQPATDPTAQPTYTYDVALGELPAFHWFTRLYHFVFEDKDEDGFRDANEPGIPEQAINLRWRDGSMYQSSATDGAGFVPFEEVFPFFAWQIAEVDYARMKATGVTVVVDNGGDPKGNTTWPAAVNADVDPAVLAPQPQVAADGAPQDGAPYRIETGPVLLEAFQGFIGQTSVMLWGKAPYAPTGSVVTDEDKYPLGNFPGTEDTDVDADGVFDVDAYHGGVSGIVHYSTTRAENDPRWGTGEPWEPGIPGVRVQLWNVDRTQLLNEVTTDSWDESLPAGCRGDVFTYLGSAKDCYDGLRNFNQVRPGVFDGGYAFYTVIGTPAPTTSDPGRMIFTGTIAQRSTDSNTVERPLPAGRYVVKVIVPDGYQLVKEEDKNVDFGDEYIPQEFYLSGYPLADAGGAAEAQPGVTVEEYPLVAPFCVGSLRDVPTTLSLFPGLVNATYGGDKRPLCDSKLVAVRDGANAAANFFLFTEAPIAGHIVGFVLDDTTNENDPNSPQFGEKYAPPFMPVSVRDWTGREITRTYTDQYGRYNALVPSTYTANAPEPSGMSPNMLTACINAPLFADGSPDPHFHKQYSHFCYTLQYMPGTTTYLDTPVLPTGAFAGSETFPVDAELPALTPVVSRITSLSQPAATGIAASSIGPYIVDRGVGGPLTDNGRLRTIEILSAGSVQVLNPAYGGITGTQPKLITRDYGFGDATTNGVVTLGGQPVTIRSWTSDRIEAFVPSGRRTGHIVVERCLTGAKALGANNCPGESRTSVYGVTLHVANPTLHALRPPTVLAANQSIQSAIDAATPGDLILVPPGSYNEMLVMRKPVRLQGWGANSTTINTVQVPAEKIQAWRDRVGELIRLNQDYLLSNQIDILGPAPYLEGAIRAALGGEGAGVTVLGKNQPTGAQGACLVSAPTPLVVGGIVVGFVYDWAPQNEAYCQANENPYLVLAVGQQPPATVLRPNARIDGFSIMGSSQDAGVAVNANARFLEITNNKVFNNYGFLAGGIRIGHPGAQLPLADLEARNWDVTIRHNMVTQNAGLDTGGGVVLGTGSDRYEVSDNFIAANFTAGWGGGIAHIGLSQGGVINRNTVIFNESFNQGIPTSGGGIFVGGRAPVLGALTPGSGNVRISNNLVQGNQAAGGDGGGIALQGVNGADVNRFGPNGRYQVRLFNNVIVNNVAGLAGGGISLQDAAYVDIVHNTVAHNDSLAVAGAAFASPTTSTPQPAGIVSRGHTPLLAQALGAGEPRFSQPTIANSTIWENRSFYFGIVASGGVVQPGQPNQYGLIERPAAQGGLFWDFGVLGAPAGSALTPLSSIVTGGETAPAFVASYFNGARNPILALPQDQVGIAVPAAFDEGGNFIRPQYGPLSLTGAGVDPALDLKYTWSGTGSVWGNYHVSAGVNGASLLTLYDNVPNVLQTDIDGDPRPVAAPHIGADQTAAAPVSTTPLP